MGPADLSERQGSDHSFTSFPSLEENPTLPWESEEILKIVTFLYGSKNKTKGAVETVEAQTTEQK